MKTQRLMRTAAATALVLVLVSGCDGILDLEPQQSISDDVALSAPSAVETALIGAYDVLGDADLFGGRFMLMADLLGDDGDLLWTGTFNQPREVWNKAILIDNSMVASQWIDSYRGINIANNVLSALDVFEDEAARNRVEGEARFVRALLYHQLVRFFGRAWHDGDPNTNLAVPIVTDPTRDITDEARLPRNTVAEVYAQIIEDLTVARNQLPAENGVFAETYTASAVLARVYLDQRRWSDAATEASRVIEESGYSLAPTYAAAFNNQTDGPEYVFAIQVSPQDGANSLNEFYGSVNPGPGRGDIELTDQHQDRYEEGDARAEFVFVENPDNPDTRAVRTAKWMQGPSGNVNIPVIRLAEMYLTRAEANLRGGTTIGADPVDDVNAIRERAELDPVASVTVQDVMDERRLELAFEGHRIFDAKRNQETIDGIAWDSPRLVYPVPRRELDANPNLVQNQGYGS